MRIAVYGSLKQGGKLHYNMQDGAAKFLGASTFPGLLYSLGAYPAAMPGDGKIVCEVYECPDALVQRLDRIEGHPWMYERQLVKTAGFGLVHAYIYQHRVHSSRPLIAGGNYDVKSWR